MEEQKDLTKEGPNSNVNIQQPKKPRNFIPDFMMDEDALFVHMEDKMSDQYSEDPTEVSTDVKKLPFVQNLIRENEILKERLRYFTTSYYKSLKDDALCTIAWHQIQNEYRQDLEDILAKSFKDNYYESSDDSSDSEANKNKEEINLDELSEPSVNTDNVRAAKELKGSLIDDKTTTEQSSRDNATSVDNSAVVTVMDPLPLDPSSSSEESSDSGIDESDENVEEEPPLPFEEAIKVEGLGLVKYYKGFCIDTCLHKLDYQNLSFKPWEVPYYERLLLDPLPLPPNKPIREIVSKCFNCGAPGHAFTDCPHPRDQKAISANRKKFLDASTNRIDEDDGRRYWDGESLTQKTRYGVFTPGVLSTALREALGMKVAPAVAEDAKEEGQIEASEEPPYYARMRIFGYPPGYIKFDTKPPPSGLIVHTDSKENDGQDDIQFNQNAMSVIEQATPGSQQPPTPLITYPGLHFDSQYFAQLDPENKTINRRHSAVNLPPTLPPVSFMSPAARSTTSWTKHNNSNASQPKYNFNHNHSTLYDNHQEEDMMIDESVRPSARQSDSSRKRKRSESRSRSRSRERKRRRTRSRSRSRSRESRRSSGQYSHRSHDRK
jgi:hypothetical protein